MATNSELDGEHGGDIQWRAQLEVALADANKKLATASKALKAALPILEDVAAGGRRLTPLNKVKNVREQVSHAIGIATQ